MNTTEDLDRTLRELADREPVTSPPVEKLLQRGRRRRRAGVGAAAFGVVAALAIGAMAAGVVSGPGPSTTAATLPTTQATAQGTFRLVLTLRMDGHDWRQEGAFDPLNRKGYLRWTDEAGNDVEQRFIGDEIYHLGPQDGPGARPLIHEVDPKLRDNPGLPPLDFPALLRCADADALLAGLRDTGTVTDLGDNRYSFRNPGTPAGGVTGTVELSAGKTTKVTYEMSHLSMTLTFSDFGLPVAVERP